MHPPPATRPRPARPGRLLAVVTVGLCGSILMSILPFAVGYLPPALNEWFHLHQPHLRQPAGRHTLRAAGAFGAAMLFWAWTEAHPTVLRPRTLHWGAAARRWFPRGLAALWAAPMLLAPPLQTADPWAYAAQGWLLVEGRNPYEVPMGVIGPFAAGIFDSWLSTTAVYPPLSLYLQGQLVELAGHHPYWSVVAMRAFPILAMIIIALLVEPLAKDLGVNPHVAAWAVLLNPLVLTQYVGGAHNDALMSALIVLALWLARRPGGLWWSMVAIGLAASIKQPAVLAGLGVAIHAAWPQVRDRDRPWLQLGLRVGAGGLLGGAVFLGVSFISGLGLGWANDTGGAPSLVISHTPLSWVAQLLIRGFGVDPGPVGLAISVVSAIVTVGAIAWAAKRLLPEQAVAFTAATLLAFGLLGAALQPWYPLWGGILLAWVRLPRRWTPVIMAAIGGLGVSAVLQEFWSPALTVPLCATLAYLWWRRFGRRLEEAL